MFVSFYISYLCQLIFQFYLLQTTYVEFCYCISLLPFRLFFFPMLLFCLLSGPGRVLLLSTSPAVQQCICFIKVPLACCSRVFHLLLEFFYSFFSKSHVPPWEGCFLPTTSHSLKLRSSRTGFLVSDGCSHIIEAHNPIAYLYYAECWGKTAEQGAIEKCFFTLDICLKFSCAIRITCCL